MMTVRPSSSLSASSSSSSSCSSWLKSLPTSTPAPLLPVWPPRGVTRNGDPLLFFPDTDEMSESELATLLSYFTSHLDFSHVSLIVDRRKQELASLIPLFTALLSGLSGMVGIREVFLLFCDVGDLDLATIIMSELVVDFDIVHLEDPTSLLIYIDAHCLPTMLGGTQPALKLDLWLSTHLELEHLGHAGQRLERALQRFVEAVDLPDNGGAASAHATREMAARERAAFQQLGDDALRLGDDVRKLELQDGLVDVVHRMRAQRLARQLDVHWRQVRRVWHLKEAVFGLLVEVAGVNERRGFNHQRRFSISQLSTDSLSDKEKKAEVSVKAICDRVQDSLQSRRVSLHALLTLALSVEASDKWSANAARLMQSQRGAEKQPPNQATVRRQRSFGDALLFTHKEQESRNNMVNNLIVHHMRQLDYLLSKCGELRLQTHEHLDALLGDVGHEVSMATLRCAEESVHKLMSMRTRVLRRREELRVQCSNEPSRKHSVVESSNESRGSEQAMKVIEELMDTERRYVSDIHSILTHYTQALSSHVHLEALMKSLDAIHSFHSTQLVPDLQRASTASTASVASVASSIASVLRRHCGSLKSLYSGYCRQLPGARGALPELGGEHDPDGVLTHCQRRAGHCLGLSAYLLKPMQRITKYELLLRELNNQINSDTLESAMRDMRFVLTIVNDSVHLTDITLKGVPSHLQPLGPLLFSDKFVVTVANNNKTKSAVRTIIMAASSSSLTSAASPQQRQVLLYDEQLVVCKPSSDKNAALHYKFSLPLVSLVVNNNNGNNNSNNNSNNNGNNYSNIGGNNEDDVKIELWAQGSNTVYSLVAKSAEAKASFLDAFERSQRRESSLRTPANVDEALGDRVIRDVASSPLIPTNPEESNEETNGGSIRLSRSRSLAARRAAGLRLRSRSVDDAADQRPNSDDHDDQSTLSRDRFVVLADYLALTDREIDLAEDEVVQLVKVGCAGWWYVRCIVYPYPEGWAPSTYLERLPAHYKQH